LVENCDLFIPLAFDAPIPLGIEKPERRGYPTVKKSLMVHLAISTEFQHDGQTNDQTAILQRHSLRYAQHCIVKTQVTKANTSLGEYQCLQVGRNTSDQSQYFAG